MTKPELCWTTETGERIPVRQMTDLHLTNAIEFMERAIAAGEDYWRTLQMFEGEDDPEGLEALTERTADDLATARTWLVELKTEREFRHKMKMPKPRAWATEVTA